MRSRAGAHSSLRARSADDDKDCRYRGCRRRGRPWSVELRPGGHRRGPAGAPGAILLGKTNTPSLRSPGEHCGSGNDRKHHLWCFTQPIRLDSQHRWQQRRRRRDRRRRRGHLTSVQIRRQHFEGHRIITASQASTTWAAAPHRAFVASGESSTRGSNKSDGAPRQSPVSHYAADCRSGLGRRAISPYPGMIRARSQSPGWRGFLAEMAWPRPRPKPRKPSGARPNLRRRRAPQ